MSMDWPRGAPTYSYGVGGKRPSSQLRDIFSVNTKTGAAGSMMFDYTTTNAGLGACVGPVACLPGWNPVPEPSTLALAGMGLAGLVSTSAAGELT